MEEMFDAIRDNNITLVKKFINQGIDVNIKNDGGFTALILASYHGYKNMVEFLLKQPRINVNTPEGIHPVNIQNKYGDTALIDASYKGDKEIVKLLLKQSEIDVTLKNNEGYNFIDFLNDKSILINYKLQKEILKNGRDDIILFLNEYKLIHPKIKDEVPELFQAIDWGLI
jgi:ankyrin repeat protein